MLNNTVGKSSATVRDINSLRTSFNSLVCSELFESTDPFSARFELIRLGNVELFKYDGEGLRGGIRSIRHIHSNPIDDFLVVMPLNVSQELVQFPNRNIIKPGSFCFLSTMKPYEGYWEEAPRHFFSELIIKIPGTMLRQQLPLIDQCCAVPFSMHEGAGKIMSSLIGSVYSESHDLSGVQARMFGHVLLNTVVAATADSVELIGLYKPPRQQAHERTRKRALEFIELNLSNQQLDTEMIAKHCRVSPRHLHTSFESASVSVGALVREMRLQFCRAELKNPMMRNHSIIQIAMRWGFSSPGSFTRAYKRYFGVVPCEDRLLQTKPD